MAYPADQSHIDHHERRIPDPAILSGQNNVDTPSHRRHTAEDFPTALNPYPMKEPYIKALDLTYDDDVWDEIQEDMRGILYWSACEVWSEHEASRPDHVPPIKLPKYSEWLPPNNPLLFQTKPRIPPGPKTHDNIKQELSREAASFNSQQYAIKCSNTHPEFWNRYWIKFGRYAPLPPWMYQNLPKIPLETSYAYGPLTRTRTHPHSVATSVERPANRNLPVLFQSTTLNSIPEENSPIAAQIDGGSKVLSPEKYVAPMLAQHQQLHSKTWKEHNNDDFKRAQELRKDHSAENSETG